MTLYVLTSPRGLSWDLGGADGGDLATAAITQGIAHPPGYPTYLVLAQLPLLLPLGSPAYRLNLFSAFCTATSSALLARIISRHVDAQNGHVGAVTGVIAGLFFGLMEIVWSQGVITEVYALAGLFCVITLFLTEWADQGPDRLFWRRLCVLGGVAGIGLGAHYLVGLMYIFSLFYLLLRSPSRMLRPSATATFLVFGLGFAVVFAYLPLRAGMVALSDWGRPDTLDRFLWMVTGSAYAGRWSIDVIVVRLAPLVRVLVEQFGIIGTIMAALGLSLVWETNRKFAISSILLLAANGIVIAGYDSTDTLPYLYPSLIILTIAVAVAIYELLQRWLPTAIRATPIRHWSAMALSLVILCAPLLIVNSPQLMVATNDAELYGIAVVRHAPAGSVIISNDDKHTFAIRYAAAISGTEHNVIPIDERLLQFDWFRQDLASGYPNLNLGGLSVGAQGSEYSSQLIAALPRDTPVVFTFRPNLPDAYHVQSSQDGLSYMLSNRP